MILMLFIQLYSKIMSTFFCISFVYVLSLEKIFGPFFGKSKLSTWYEQNSYGMKFFYLGEINVSFTFTFLLASISNIIYRMKFHPYYPENQSWFHALWGIPFTQEIHPYSPIWSISDIIWLICLKLMEERIGKLVFVFRELTS